ncbi:MAG: hypothetical protein ACREBU_05605, partial [Nitrososphaera sp.]
MKKATMTYPKLSKDIARKVLQIVDAGLVRGLGTRKPGHMCVEAAVCYAFDLPHGDNPPCVGKAVRAYKIRLNDSHWSSDAERAKGMRRVAIAQLGSDKIGQEAFQQELAIGTVKRILPIALRAAAKKISAHAVALEDAAVMCEAVTEFAQCYATAKKAFAVAAAAATAAYAADAADAYAANAAAAAATAAYAADAADA